MGETHGDRGALRFRVAWILPFVFLCGLARAGTVGGYVDFSTAWSDTHTEDPVTGLSADQTVQSFLQAYRLDFSRSLSRRPRHSLCHRRFPGVNWRAQTFEFIRWQWCYSALSRIDVYSKALPLVPNFDGI